MPDMAPLVYALEADIPAQGTANAVTYQAIGEVPVAGTVSSVSIIPHAAVVAHGTNYRTFRVANKGADGSGTAIVASFATDTVTTDNLAHSVEKQLTLSATPADLAVAAGDVLAVDETVAAAGVAHGGYRVKVEISRS